MENLTLGRRDPTVSCCFEQQLETSSDKDAEAKQLQAKVIDFRSDERLLAFISSNPRALIYHHPAWLSALAGESGQECFMLACEAADGSLIGIMPLAYTRGLPFNVFHHQTKRRISSLPRTPFVGPIAANPEATSLLLTDALQRAESEGVQLQIKSDNVLPQRVRNELARTEWRPTYVLELPDSVDQLTFGNARGRHRINWSLKQARKYGLVVRTAETEPELEAWYDLYLTTMRENFTPPRSYGFFLSLWRSLKESHSFKLLIAEKADGVDTKLLAGAIFLRMGETVSYAFCGWLPEYAQMHANDLILSEAIRQSCQDGYRFFDFGEVPEEQPELVRFKTKWGAVCRPLYRFYAPAIDESALSHKAHWIRPLLRRAWQLVPLWITARVGEWLYSYL